VNGLTWSNGGAAIMCSGLGALILAMAVFVIGQWLRRVRDVMDTGDGQGGIPGHDHLRKVTADTDREHLPVTRAMSLAELDAVHGPKLGDVVSQDSVITEQWRAAWGEVADALTPRMVAPTRADLPAVRCHRHRTGSTAFPCTCGGDGS